MGKYFLLSAKRLKSAPKSCPRGPWFFYLNCSSYLFSFRILFLDFILGTFHTIIYSSYIPVHSWPLNMLIRGWGPVLQYIGQLDTAVWGGACCVCFRMSCMRWWEVRCTTLHLPTLLLLLLLTSLHLHHYYFFYYSSTAAVAEVGVPGLKWWN